MTGFQRGDLVHPVGEPSTTGVVLDVLAGMPYVRWGTDNHAGLYWPHDVLKVAR